MKSVGNIFVSCGVVIAVLFMIGIYIVADLIGIVLLGVGAICPLR